MFRPLFSHRLSALTVLGLLVLCGSLAAQEVYKWTDEDGNIRYGDKPPAGTESVAGVTKLAGTTESESITKTAVKVATSEEGGITRNVLYANEQFSSHSQVPSRIVVSDDVLWLTFKDSVLTFDPRTRTSTKYQFDRIERGLSGQYMEVLGDNFVFFQKDRDRSNSAFHVYSHVSDFHNEIPIATTPTNIIFYDDKYNDGLFAFLYAKKLLIQYTFANGFGDTSAVSEVVRPVDGDVSGIHGLSTNTNGIWFLSGHRKDCALGFHGKRSNAVRRFNSDEIGLPSSNGCSTLAADDDEVWVTSRANRRSSTFSIYDIKNDSWELIEKSANGIALNATPLQMDSESVYYNSCEKLVAIDRTSRLAKVLRIDRDDPDNPHTSCISVFKLHDTDLWALVFETENHRDYPVLYKIPTRQMKQ